MREVGDYLDIFPEPEGPNLIEHEGEEDKERKEQHILHKTDNQGIGQNLGKGRTGKNHLKILESYKRPASPSSELIER